jgi:hypothetical protein
MPCASWLLNLNFAGSIETGAPDVTAMTGNTWQPIVTYNEWEPVPDVERNADTWTPRPQNT